MNFYKFGLSKEFDCSYLPTQKERLLVYIDDEPMSAEQYAAFQNEGFRRSQDIVYRPHCNDCNQCQSIRLEVNKFKPSKSQKRISNKCRKFTVSVVSSVSPDYYELFEQYINQRHNDGVMYPAEPNQLASFAHCEWMSPLFIEIRDGSKLIAVGISDPSSISLSAVYSFFDPSYEQYSLGTFLVLKQIEIAQQSNRTYLYLGYFISDCKKMNYKTNFKPYQIRKKDLWYEVQD